MDRNKILIYWQTVSSSSRIYHLDFAIGNETWTIWNGNEKQFPKFQGIPAQKYPLYISFSSVSAHCFQPHKQRTLIIGLEGNPLRETDMIFVKYFTQNMYFLLSSSQGGAHQSPEFQNVMDLVDISV